MIIHLINETVLEIKSLCEEKFNAVRDVIMVARRIRAEIIVKNLRIWVGTGNRILFAKKYILSARYFCKYVATQSATKKGGDFRILKIFQDELQIENKTDFVNTIEIL